MSFQWVIDNCEALSIDLRKMVATTIARDGNPRSVSRGVPPRRFIVKMPDGMRWSENLSSIQSITDLDRVTTDTITIPYDKFPWFYNNIDPGTDPSYTVLCVSFPQWTIFSRNQVSWDGPFVFVEVSA